MAALILAPDWAELEVELWEDGSSGGSGTLQASIRVPLKDSFWLRHISEELTLQMEHASGAGSEVCAVPGLTT